MSRHVASSGRVLLSQLVLSVLLSSTYGLRFIAAPLLAISPAMDIMGVAAQLHSRGHEVLVVVSASALGFVKQAAARHSSNTTAEGLEYLTVNITFREFTPPKPLKIGEVPKPSRFAIPDRWPQSMLFKMTSGLDMLQLFQPGVAIMAHQMLSNETLMQRLRAHKADAWMGVGLSIGSVVKDNSGCIMAHALGIPAVDVSGNAFFSGTPSSPQFGTGLTPTDLKTLPGMALNLATWASHLLTPLRTDLSPSATDRLREQYGLPWAASPCLLTQGLRRLMGIKTLGCRPLLEVHMGSWLVEYPRTLPANQVLVGPGTARPAHAISPPDVADFVNSAPQGLVLAAFGTVYGPTLRPEDIFELCKGFAALAPTRVLWALKPASLPPGVQLSELPLGSNTKVVPWVDYNDVLGHPHTRVFVSHCGLHSVNEAAYHGVPLLALPFQMEQAEHATKLVVRGAAVICPQSPAFRRGSAAAAAMTFDGDKLAALIQQVMTNASYAESARGTATALQTYAAHRHPYERAADEIELALYASHLITHTAGGSAAQAGGHDSSSSSSSRRSGQSDEL